MKARRLVQNLTWLAVVGVLSSCGGGGFGGGGRGGATANVVGASALSRHYVRVDFDVPVADDATDPARYSIKAPNGVNLAANEARVADDPAQVILTTAAQDAERAFVVQLRAQADASGDLFVGRVEHIASGAAVRFGSAEELIAFIARVLAPGACC